MSMNFAERRIREQSRYVALLWYFHGRVRRSADDAMTDSLSANIKYNYMIYIVF